MILTLPLIVSRTCEALAVTEVHALHALGELDLVDGTCRKEGEKREKEKMRNEGRAAAGLKTI